LPNIFGFRDPQQALDSKPLRQAIVSTENEWAVGVQASEYRVVVVHEMQARFNELMLISE
jgi:hypothetical protein